MVTCRLDQHRAIDAQTAVAEASENALKALLLRRCTHGFEDVSLLTSRSAVNAQAVAQASAVLLTVVYRAIATFSSQFNESASVNCLPSEIFLDILRRLSFSDRVSASHVCKLWRDHALSQATLWTTLKVTGGRIPSDGVWTLLDRSRCAPLDLVLFVPRVRDKLGADFSTVAAVVSTHLHRMRTLTLICDEDTDWDLLDVSLMHPAPLLESFTIRTRPGATAGLAANVFGGYAPTLRRLALEYVQVPSAPYPAVAFASVTELHYMQAHMSAEDMMRVLSNCPNLRTVSLHATSIGRGTSISALALAPDLKTLDLSRCYPRIAEDILECMHDWPSIHRISMYLADEVTIAWLMSYMPDVECLAIEFCDRELRYPLSIRLGDGKNTWTRLVTAADPTVASELLQDNSNLFRHLASLALPDVIWLAMRGDFPMCPALAQLEVLLSDSRFWAMYSASYRPGLLSLGDFSSLGAWVLPKLEALHFRPLRSGWVPRVQVEAEHLCDFLERAIRFESARLHRLILFSIPLEDSTSGLATATLRERVQHLIH